MKSSRKSPGKLILQAFLIFLFCVLLPGVSAQAEIIPTISANMSNDGFTNYVFFGDWPAETDVTLTIYDSEGPDANILFNPPAKTTDSEGNLDFPEWELGDVQLQPGYYLVGEDGTTTKTLTVHDLTVEDVDVLNQKISGTGPYPENVRVTAYLDDSYSDQHTVTAEVQPDGTWEADFSGASFELTYQTLVDSYVYDPENDSTGYAYTPPPPPNFVVSHDQDWIASRHWDYGTELTITIDDDENLQDDPLYQGTFTHQPDDAVNWFTIDFSSIIDLQPGQFVSVEGGGLERIHKIDSLTVIAADPKSDIVYGTADPDSLVIVEFAEGAEWAVREVTAGPDGSWSADFSEEGAGWGGEVLWDIEEYSCGSAFVYDQDGDQTQDNWCAALINPRISNNPELDRVDGDRWWLGTRVTMTIEDPETPESPDYQEIQEIVGGEVDFRLRGIIDIKPGLIITMMDEYITKTHIVSSITINGYDLEENTIFGTADPGDYIHIEVEELGEIDTTADDGTWTVDFGDQDIQAGDFIWAFRLDGGNDSTRVWKKIPDPRFVVSHDQDWIATRHWDYGTELTITIDDDENLQDDPLYQGTFTHQPDDEVNWFRIDFSGIFDLQPDHFVQVSDGLIDKVHQVKALEVTEADPLTNKVYGTAEPGSPVEIEFAEGDDFAVRLVHANAAGEWWADFSEPGLGPGGEYLWDIEEYSCGSTFIHDQDFDRTQDDWCAAFINPRFGVQRDLELVGGDGWRVGEEVTMIIEDPATSESPDHEAFQVINEEGLYFDLKGIHDIQAGQVITMQGERVTKTHLVSSVAITGYDLQENTISGVADPGDYIHIGVEEVGEINTTAEDGTWSVNFGDNDIQAGDFIWAFRMDGGNDNTHVWLKIPYPDSDGDGFLDNEDNAPNIYNPDQSDLDGDGVGDVADPCPSDLSDSCDPANSTSAVIGPGGGQLTTFSGDVQITIPENALAEELSISFTDLGIGFELTTDLGLCEAVLGVEAGPPGTVFDPPATMIFRWDDSDSNGVVDGTEIAEEDLYVVKDGTALTDPCSSYDLCDLNTNTIQFTVNSFSEFILAGLLNRPPTAEAGGPYQVQEGQSVILDASGSSDPDGDLLSFSWDLDGDGAYDDLTGPTAEIDFTDDGVYTFSVRVVDPDGAADTAFAQVAVDNVAPQLGEINAPLDPVEISSSVDVSAAFTDPGADSWTALWDWGDGSTSPGEISSKLVSGSHTYSGPGVYTLTLTISDDDGGEGEISFEYLVVYDPAGGFVTGGGWINSPEGAYIPDPSLVGKASFGFVSKYKKGAEVPEGKTEFHFKTADFHFQSTAYQWLVISGKQARFKGQGQLNGQGEYGFMIAALDGDLQGGDGIDRFRIKIWDMATEEIIYDNQLGDVEDSDPSTGLGGGSIVIHKK